MSDVGQSGQIFEPRKPACNACREKKVRCDQNEPSCNNCLNWNVTCTYSARKKRPVTSAVSRTLEDVDTRLSRLEERLEERMDAVTRLLEALPIKEHPVSIPARSFDAFTNPSQCSSAVTALDLKCQPIIKDARGKTHFIAVNSVMQMIIEAENEVLVTSPAGIASPQLGTSLQSEKSNLLTDTDFKEFKGLEYTNVPHRIDIGEREAVRVCKIYFELATKFYPMFDEEIFMARVRATYTNPETLNDTACAHQEHARAWHVQQIGNAAWKVLGTYPYWPTSLLKVQALVTGALYAQELARPGLVWSLVSAACRESLAIGLQRDCSKNLSLSAAERRDRQAAFWQVYILDRKLGLNFGKACSIPEYEIDVPLPTYSGSTWVSGIIACVKLSEIQGRIYESLYSPKGLRKPVAEYRSTIDILDQDLRLWWTQYGQHAFDGCPSSTYSQTEYVKLELTFNYHATLVMLHRMDQSQQNVSLVAVQEARKGIGSIRSAVQSVPRLAQSMLVLWLFLFYSFGSFFAIFTYIINNPYSPTLADDVALLEFVVAMLTTPRFEKEGPQRMHRIATVFLGIAKTVQALSQSPRTVSKRPRSVTSKGTRSPINLAASEHLASTYDGNAFPDSSSLNKALLTGVDLQDFPWDISLPPDMSTLDHNYLQADGTWNGQDMTLYDDYLDHMPVYTEEVLTEFDWLMWDQSQMWPMNPQQ